MKWRNILEALMPKGNYYLREKENQIKSTQIPCTECLVKFYEILNNFMTLVLAITKVTHLNK